MQQLVLATILILNLFELYKALRVRDAPNMPETPINLSNNITQFIEPVSFKEAFTKAKDITDLLI